MSESSSVLTDQLHQDLRTTTSSVLTDQLHTDLSTNTDLFQSFSFPELEMQEEQVNNYSGAIKDGRLIFLENDSPTYFLYNTLCPSDCLSSLKFKKRISNIAEC